MVDGIDATRVNRLLNTIERHRSGLAGSLQKIASGRRLQRAGEDPAAHAIAARLRSDIRVLAQAFRNVESGMNFVRTAEAGLQTVSDLLLRGRELAVQAANGTLGEAERRLVNEEFAQIKTEIDRIAESGEFNGQKLFDGSLAPDAATRLDVQAGSGSGPENRISLNVIERLDAAALGLGAVNLSTAEDSLAALAPLEQATGQITAARGRVGAAANRLTLSGQDLALRVENLTRSESALADTDLAMEISDLQKGLNQFQVSLRTLALDLQQNERTTGGLLDFTA